MDRSVYSGYGRVEKALKIDALSFLPIFSCLMEKRNVKQNTLLVLQTRLRRLGQRRDCSHKAEIEK